MIRANNNGNVQCTESIRSRSLKFKHFLPEFAIKAGIFDFSKHQRFSVFRGLGLGLFRLGFRMTGDSGFGDGSFSDIADMTSSGSHSAL